MKYKYINLRSKEKNIYNITKISSFIVTTILIAIIIIQSTSIKYGEVLLIESEIDNINSMISIPIYYNKSKEVVGQIRLIEENVGTDNIESFDIYQDRVEVIGTCKSVDELMKLREQETLKDLSVDFISKESKKNYKFKISFEVGNKSDI